MQKEEAQGSWSFNNIMWTIVVSIVTAVLGGILGYGLKYLFDPSEKRILTISENQTENLLNLDQKVYDEIITTYTLRNRPAESIKSYFRYSATIHNTGDIGVEKLKVFVHVDNSDVILAKSPSITTVPSDIHQGISFQQNKKIVEPSRDEWEVSLLNPHESITFTYIGYSTREISSVSFKLVPRKKDWEVIREEAKTHSENNSFFDRTIAEIQGEDLPVLTLMLVCVQMLILLYLIMLLMQTIRQRFIQQDYERLSRVIRAFSQSSVHDDSDSSTDST